MLLPTLVRVLAVIVTTIVTCQWSDGGSVGAAVAMADDMSSFLTEATKSSSSSSSRKKVIPLSATILFNDILYHPGQSIRLTITRNDTIIPKEVISIVIAPENATNLTINEYYDSTRNVFHSRIWPSKNKTAIFNVKFLQNQYGLYQIGFLQNIDCCSYNLLGIANNMIRISNPIVSINLPQKDFFQGEVIQFNINNPYIDFNYSPRDVQSYPPGYTGHRFNIIPIYPSVYEKKIHMIEYENFTIDSQKTQYTIVPYDVDEYKIILEQYTTQHSGVIGGYENSYYICDVANSTFTVKRNYPMLTLQTQSTGNCTTDLLKLSLTTMNKIPLIGPYTIDIVSTRNEMIRIKSKRMKEMVYPKSTLNTSFLFKSKSFRQYRARIMLDNILWAATTPFYSGCY